MSGQNVDQSVVLILLENGASINAKDNEHFDVEKFNRLF